jgi:hypothetical protein
MNGWMGGWEDGWIDKYIGEWKNEKTRGGVKVVLNKNNNV